MSASNEFDIAIVGMAGRFPGASNLHQFWQNLSHGVESITRFSDEELLAAGVPPSSLQDPRYVKASPILEEPGGFDAQFFRFSPDEARTMDPQHRILLELAYEALEDAGYDAERYDGRIGVFTGSALNTYFLNAEAEARLRDDYIPTLIGTDKDFLSTRIAYKLNLKGPSLTVQTACSTSIVAVHLARQSLLTHETDMVLAGGISVRVPHCAGYFIDGGGIVSPDGHVRAFDSGANGTVFGSGGGVVVLKRLADAIADGDTIHAVIKGSAVNNDGSEKAGYTAPSVNGQAEAIVEALANAGVDADRISYIEAHGSGTPVGDPVEIRALTKAFRSFTPRTNYCAIGSVKTNVGHLDAAAAITGIIKTVLALKNRKIPPSLNFREPNPEINFGDTPFYVNTTLQDWKSDAPRLAGVMSTGMGGTNAHLILEEAPTAGQRDRTRKSELLVLSARTESALDHATQRLEAFLTANPSGNIEDVAHTLQVGRKSFPYRRYLVTTGLKDAVMALKARDPKEVFSARSDESRHKPVVMLLPGVGDQYVGMAHELYQNWPAFREQLDKCAQILKHYIDTDIREILYPESQSWKRESSNKGIDLKKLLGRDTSSASDVDAEKLNRTRFVQPTLFAVEYALAKLWESLGVTPDRIVGHSMGEYVAACLSGVFSLEDALRLIATRARLVDELPQGRMLAVMMSEQELQPLLRDSVSIALINGPNLCVVAGEGSQIDLQEQQLQQRGIVCRKVQNGHAFHSPMLNPVIARYEAEVRKVELHTPKIPFISNVTGGWITAQDATDPAYWARHMNHPARFNNALQKLWQIPNATLIEAGPGRTLSVLAMQHPDQKQATDPVSVTSLRHSYENRSDDEVLLQSIGKLWSVGTAVRWENLPHSERRRISLPTYPFERQNYWYSSNRSKAPSQARPRSNAGIDDWFYAPTWERTTSLRENGATQNLKDAHWLIFADQQGEGASLQAKLEQLGIPAIFVRFGDWFFRRGNNFFELNAELLSGYLGLFRELQGRSPQALNIVHLGSAATKGKPNAEAVASNQKFGFYSLLYIAQAIGELRISFPVKIGMITKQLHQVTGEERVDPTMATVAGACGVIRKEFPNVRCFNIDLAEPRSVSHWSDETVAAILSEFNEPVSDVVAYRGKYRWLRKYEPIHLSKGSSSPLRSGGVYLITGGTGGIGLAIAKDLAATCQPRLILTRKSAFPEKSKWHDIHEKRSASESILSVIDKLMDIEAAGAQVELRVADCSDKAQMKRVLDETLAKHGTINGVIHAAGIVRAGLIQATRKEAADGVLTPKVYGTMVLFELLHKLKGRDLDFAVLFSSMASVNTPYAQYDYTAANAFLDSASCFFNSRLNFRTLTVNWPGWKDVGQLANLNTPAGVDRWKEEALAKAIATADGVEAFRRALNSGFAQVVVSPENLEDVLRESETFESAKYLLPVQNEGKGPARRTLQASDLPTNDVEARLVEIWCGVFGINQIAIHDNFFEIGGHSLLAARIVSQIERKFGKRLSLRSIFRTPTIAQLAATLQGAPAPHVVPVNAVDKQSHLLLWLGGGPILRTLAKQLEDELSVMAVTMPDEDLSSLERPFRLEDVARRMAAQIKELGAPEPFLLGGWSLYSLLTYEVARQLELEGYKVGLAVLVDPPPVPAWTPRWYQFAHSISSFMNRVQRRTKFHLSVFWNMPYQKKVSYISGLVNMVKLRLQPHRWQKVRHDGNLENPRDFFEEVLFLSYFKYVPASYSGRVLFLQPQHRGPDYWNQAQNWGNVARDFEVFGLPGDHVTMFHQSNSEMLAQHVRDSIHSGQQAEVRPKSVAAVPVESERKSANAS